MDVSMILNACRWADGDIRRMRARMRRLRECATGATAQLDMGGGRGSGGTDRMAQFAADVNECEERIAKREEAHRAELLAVTRILDHVPEPECTILYRYYVQGETLGGIAQALNYSVGHVKKKKSRGVQMADQVDAATYCAILPEWYEDYILGSMVNEKYTGKRPKGYHQDTQRTP